MGRTPRGHSNERTPKPGNGPDSEGERSASPDGAGVA